MMRHGGVIVRDCTVDLLGAAEHYLELSLRTQNLCTSLREFVKKSRDDQIIIDRALAFKEVRISLSDKDCKEIIEALRIVRGEVICVEEFESVYNSHAEMQSQLRMVQRKADRKIKRLSKLCVKQGLENVCERGIWLISQFDLVEAVNLGTFVSCKDVESMRVLVDWLHGELGRTAKSIEFGERHGDSCALLLCLEDLRKKQPEFLKHLDDFERQTYVCNATISKARAVVLQKLLTTCLIH